MRGSKRISLVLAAAGCLLMIAASAASASPAIKYRSNTFSVDVGQENLPRGVRCANGWHALSGGVFISVGLAVVNHSYPVDLGDQDAKPDDGWHAAITNQSGVSSPVTVYAVCVEFMPKYSAYTTTFPGELSTGQSCPEGTRVAGAGVATSPTVDAAFIRTWGPYGFGFNGPRRMSAVINGTGTDTSATVLAICTDELNLRYERKELTIPAAGSNTKSVRCAGGRRVVGGGGVQQTVGTGWDLRTLVSSPSDTVGDDDTKPDDSWRIDVRNDSGEERSIPLVAVCAKQRGLAPPRSRFWLSFRL